MCKTKYCLNKKILFIAAVLFSFVFVCFSLFIVNNAFADDEDIIDTVTIKGKVVDGLNEPVKSAQIQYTDGKDVHSLHYADVSGGMFFAIPATSDCTLTFYQDGYKPETRIYTAETLQNNKPVMDIGEIRLSSEDYVKVSGHVYDLFYSKPVSGVCVVYFLPEANDACKAQTNENGDFSLTVPKKIIRLFGSLK